MTGDSERGVVIRKLQQHTDPRGSVFEPLASDAIAGQRNAHVVLTGPGHVRGNHYHTRGTEVLVVRGPALVRYREVSAGSESESVPPSGPVRDVEVAEGDVVSFRFPAYVPHAVRNTGSREGLIVAFRDVEHDPDGGDTERDVLI